VKPKKRVAITDEIDIVSGLIKSLNLRTVCEEAICPNLCECYSRKTATFIILGNICTRSCRFCAVKHDVPSSFFVDTGEHVRIAEAVNKLQLKHVVITSVTRDDLKDGGASQFVNTIKEIKKNSSSTVVEVLIPDFFGSIDSLQSVVSAKPDIIAHNIETVPRLYSSIRSKAVYSRSLAILTRIGELSGNTIPAKSGIMLGLGESLEEVQLTLADLRNAGCRYLTIGQYLQPTGRQVPVEKYYSDEDFKFFHEYAVKMGFEKVKSGHFVRSSYMV